MLAMVGLLSELHKQGVAALLGGALGSDTSNSSTDATSSSSGSSSSSRLPFPEPASLFEFRRQAGLSLRAVYQAHLWAQQTACSGPAYSEHLPQLGSIPEHVRLAFGVGQLAWYDTPAHEAYGKVLVAAPSHRQVGAGGPSVAAWMEVPLVKEYTTWVRACLLKIINDVLVQHAS
jgi:hypothetical protein